MAMAAVGATKMPFNPIRDLREQASNSMPVRNGRFSPWQLADWLIPGNVYDNQTGQFRPQGIGAGALQMATGFPAGATERLSGLFRGNSGGPAGDRTGLGPTLPSGQGERTDGFGNPIGQAPARAQAGPQGDAFGNTLGQTLENGFGPRAVQNAAMSDIASQTRGTQGSGSTEEWLAGGGGDDRQRGSTRLGAGQLGAGGAAFLSDHMRSIFNRNGTTAER